jgi:hypothetical protein
MVLDTFVAPDVEIGVEVVFQGLVNDTDLNGQRGTVCVGPRRGAKVPVVLLDGECRVQVPVRCLYVRERLEAHAPSFDLAPAELAALIAAERDRFAPGSS